MPPGARLEIPPDKLKELRDAGYVGPDYVSSQEIYDDLVKQYLGKGDGSRPGKLPPLDGFDVVWDKKKGEWKYVQVGGGGGDGGGGGSSAPSAKQLAAMRANYAEILRRWGISPSAGGLENLIEHAVHNTWSSTQFMQAVRKTKPYHQQFMGIQWQEGMSEGAYLAKYAAYKGMAQDVGVKLDKKGFGILLKKGVDTREWAFRVKALDSINTNKPLLDWYEKVLKANGQIKPKEQLSKKERFKIVTKQGSKQFEQAYQEAWLSYNLSSLGVTIGKHGKDFTRAQLNNLIKQTESGTPGFEVESLGAKDFAQLAATIKQTIPLSRLYKEGLTKRDLVELSLGGPRASEIADRAQRVMATAQAATQDKVNAQFVQTGEKSTKLLYGGLGGEKGA